MGIDKRPSPACLTSGIGAKPAWKASLPFYHPRKKQTLYPTALRLKRKYLEACVEYERRNRVLQELESELTPEHLNSLRQQYQKDDTEQYRAKTVEGTRRRVILPGYLIGQYLLEPSRTQILKGFIQEDERGTNKQTPFGVTSTSRDFPVALFLSRAIDLEILQ